MKKISFFLLTTICSLLLQAQEGAPSVDIEMNADGGSWYSSPWLWIIGAAVFILLLVALTQRKSE